MPVSNMPSRFASSTGPSFEPIRSHGGLWSFTGTPRWIFSTAHWRSIRHMCRQTCQQTFARHMCRSNRLRNKSPQLIAWYVRGNDVADHASQTHAPVKTLCVGRGGQQIRAKESWFAARSASWCGYSNPKEQNPCTCATLIHPPEP